MIYLFDWGDTLMKDDPEARGPMVSWPVVALCENALPMLECLSRRHDLYIATNAADSREDEIRAALDRVGIGVFIQGIFCYRRLGVKKPSRAFFDAIITELGCRPEDLTMVGDHPENDVIWATDHGARGILYDPFERHAHCTYPRITDLMALCREDQAFKPWGPQETKNADSG